MRVTCPLCGADTCFAHREPREHRCARASEEGTALRGIGGGGPSAAAILAAARGGAAPKTAIAAGPPSLPPRGADGAAPPKQLSARDAALARTVTLMRVKAKVPPAEVKRVPEPSRLFVEARLAGAGAPSAGVPVYICVDSATATVGALVDVLAARLGVRNSNATTSEDAKRLHIYASIPNGQPLPFGAKLSQLMADGTLANGCSVFLVCGLLPEAAPL